MAPGPAALRPLLLPQRGRWVAGFPDPDRPVRYFGIRGRVVGISTDGAAEHIETLAMHYTGAPYGWYRGPDQVRLILTIAADRIISRG